MKKIKHTHTIYKTVHHHHTHHEPFTDYSFSPSEDHEHFHHMHIHDDRPSGQHSQPVPEINIPEFLPEVAVNTLGLKLPDIPHEVSHLPKRHVVPLYRRNKVSVISNSRIYCVSHYIPIML